MTHANNSLITYRHKPTGGVATVLATISEERLDSLKSDARKILRQESAPFKGKPWTANEYLPEPTPEAERYANHVLSLVAPVVEIWIVDSGSKFCSMSDLEEIT